MMMMTEAVDHLRYS